MTRREPAKRRSISLKINADVIAQLLRLDSSMRILGARSEIHGERHTLVLAIDAPKAPEGALEIEPAYVRDAGPDPVRLEHVDWVLRGGERFRQSFAPPTLAPGPDGAVSEAELDAYLARLRGTPGAGPSAEDIAAINQARAQAGEPPLEL